MNLPEAHDTARKGADRFGNTWRVFRMPLCPAAVYGCKAGDLPSEAIVIATYPNLEVRTMNSELRTSHSASAAAATDAQGSLF